MLVEALALGRNAIGIDVDPVAAFVSRIKTHCYRQTLLNRDAEHLLAMLAAIRRPNIEYMKRQFQDLSDRAYWRVVRDEHLAVPPIPNLFHWFRRYVIIDLARIVRSIQSLAVNKTHHDLFLLSFASIIRNASNADPVPVSGLEVTSYMKRKDARGRVIDPFLLFDRALRRALAATADFRSALHDPLPHSRVLAADATEISRCLHQPVDAVITSPPYHSAVDYYRRHTLETYWLGLALDHQDRLRLKPRYIGLDRVSPQNPLVRDHCLESPLAAKWERLLRQDNPRRADSFKHYIVAMRKCLSGIATRLPSGQPAVFVVGKNVWNGATVPTVAIFKEIGAEHYTFREQFWYPLRNRYMSYSRHNCANINKEYVIVLERT